MTPEASERNRTRIGEPASQHRWTRVLVFHIGSLGDTVLSVPALSALRDHVGPAATITMLHNDGPSARVGPTQVIPDGIVDDAIPFMGPVDHDDDASASNGLSALARRVADGAKRTAAAAAIVRDVRRRRFDAVVNVALADRPAATLRRDRMFFRLCGIDDIVGFDPVDTSAVRHEAQVRLDRLAHSGITADLGDGPWLIASEPARAEANRWRVEAGIGDGRAIVTVAPGTLMDAKRWPIDRWEALGVHLVEIGLIPVVVGGPADSAEGDSLVAVWAGGANAAGALSPAGSAALMASAELHVGVDTGTTHLAAAAGTPVVALYSQRAPIEQWAPLGSGHQLVDHLVPCAGCQAVDCPVQGHPCMTGIAFDEVWRRVELVHERAASR